MANRTPPAGRRFHQFPKLVTGRCLWEPPGGVDTQATRGGHMPGSPQAVSPHVPASEPALTCRHGSSLQSGDPAPSPGRGPSPRRASAETGARSPLCVGGVLPRGPPGARTASELRCQRTRRRGQEAGGRRFTAGQGRTWPLGRRTRPLGGGGRRGRDTSVAAGDGGRQAAAGD